MISENPMIQPYILLNTQNTAVITNNRNAFCFYELYKSPEPQPLTFIPTPFTDIIIAYNTSGDGCIYCVHTPSCTITLTPDNCTKIIGVRFDDALRLNIQESPPEPVTRYTPENNDMTAALLKQLTASLSFDTRTSLINAFLNNKISLCPTKLLKLRTAIKTTNGCITINGLSEITGYSNRQINRIFTEYWGYGPKDYCRLIRFQQALSEIIKNPRRSNSEFIAHIGYSDQAHFQREFKQFMNETPRQFIKKLMKAENPTLQHC